MSDAIGHGAALAARLGLAASIARGVQALDMSRRGIAYQQAKLKSIVPVAAVKQVRDARPNNTVAQGAQTGSPSVDNAAIPSRDETQAKAATPATTQTRAVQVPSGRARAVPASPRIKLNLLGPTAKALVKASQAAVKSDASLPAIAADRRLSRLPSGGGTFAGGSNSEALSRGLALQPGAVTKRLATSYRDPAAMRAPNESFTQTTLSAAQNSESPAQRSGHAPAGVAFVDHRRFATKQPTSDAGTRAAVMRAGTFGDGSGPAGRVNAPVPAAPTRQSTSVPDRQNAQQGQASFNSGTNVRPDPAEPSTPSAAAQANNGPTEGDVYLDGTLMGRWMARSLSEQAARPASGSAAFDPRRGVFPTGAMIGG